MRYLVTGLESSCTKIVSRLIAYNLNIISSIDEWSGHDEIADDKNLVCHRSIPHGPGNYFIDDDFINSFDKIVVCIRDWNCSLLSKIENHQHNPILAYEEHKRGTEIIKKIISNNSVYIFSSEAAFLLQDSYITFFMQSLNISNVKSIVFENSNNKYIKDIGL